MEYPLGTDNLGREIHLELIHATPAILKIVLAGAILSVGLGTIIGTVAGYKSGRLDYVVMTLSDTWLAIPGLALIIVISEIMNPKSPYIIGLILGINAWPGLARTIRSEVLSLREEAVIEAGRVMGLSDWRILRKYVISSLMPYISVNAATSAQRVIFATVGLYFIGVLPQTQSNWGVMMRNAFRDGNMTDITEIHWLVLPMVLLSLFTLGLIFCGQALDRLFNVHLRARHAADGEDEEELDTGASAASGF
jgi:peptide/nickel transport system permease protein